MRSHFVSAMLGAVVASCLFLVAFRTPPDDWIKRQDVLEFLSHVSMVDFDDGQGGTVRTVRITGLNVQIVNGLEATETVNGAGNLIVGYNEPCCGQEPFRTGSHNIAAGRNCSYQSFGGVVAGYDNSANAPYSAIIGGRNNNTAVQYAVVIGGSESSAFGLASVAIGGYNANVGGAESCVTGGSDNSTSGPNSVVSGGNHRTASGQDDWAAGSLWEDQ